MVLKIKDYSWNQTDDGIFISIPLKGRRKNDVDTMITDSYIKVNFNPYFFECFLFDTIDDINGKVVYCDGVLMLSLSKINKCCWDGLNATIYDDREAARQKRDIELDKYMKKVQQIDKEKNDQKAEGNKYSLKEMMQLESRQKDRIKNVKERETSQAMHEVEEWKQRQRIEAERFRVNQEKVTHQEERVQLAIDDARNMSAKDNLVYEPVRRSGTIEVSFSAREFPTPERESVKEREEEWLKKQREVATIRAERVTRDMKDEERNPEWLKNKGNSLFSAGDFSGALAAYSMALDISKDHHALYSNRSACHIKLRNFFKAIEDASKALELLNPPVTHNVGSRVKAHLRRGAAFCNLEMYREGLLDYEAALRLDPGNETIKGDIANLRSM